MEASRVKITKEQAIETAWRRAVLSWLLDSNQKSLYDLFHNNSAKIQTWLLARRSGKTHTLCVLAIEYCLKNKGSIVKFVAPNKKQVERNIRPLMTQILESCPDDIKPEYVGKDEIYFFPNGSEIQLCGAEKGNIDSIRGGFAHIAIVDEAQDVSELKYAVNSVLLPTTLTTKGKVLLSGTPPKNPDHEFVEFIESCEEKQTLIKRTVYDNPRLSIADIKEQVEAMNGENTEDFRREFLCEIIKSSSNSVIPEFDDAKILQIVKEWNKPDFYHPYVSMDLGFKDWTVVLFGYYDFFNDKFVIEDEIVTHGNEMHLYKLGFDILNKEQKLWTNPITNEIIKPKKRVSDHDLIAINEIKKATNYKVSFEKAEKAQMVPGINFIRTLINSNKIVISPRCVTLIRHLKHAKWTSSDKEKLGHGADGSHYDAVPTLSYMIRAVDFKANPYPKNYNSPLRNQDAFYVEKPNQVDNVEFYKRMYNIKRK
jgi:PBSX family phage terminase large subunit